MADKILPGQSVRGRVEETAKPARTILPGQSVYGRVEETEKPKAKPALPKPKPPRQMREEFEEEKEALRSSRSGRSVRPQGAPQGAASTLEFKHKADPSRQAIWKGTPWEADVEGLERDEPFSPTTAKYEQVYGYAPGSKYEIARRAKAMGLTEWPTGEDMQAIHQRMIDDWHSLEPTPPQEEPTDRLGWSGYIRDLMRKRKREAGETSLTPEMINKANSGDE